MSKIYEKLIRPVLFKLQPETAHEFGIEVLRKVLSSEKIQKFVSEKLTVDDEILRIEKFGLNFKNPLGVAAGFDKNGVVVNQLAALGFSFVEVGTVTLNAQKGNEKPRLFRLPADEALINRLGFNNEGTEKVTGRLKKITPHCVLGINIGRNKDVPNEKAVENYLKSFDLAHKAADYLAVNVSSPNTPDLRELQKAENLEELLSQLQRRNFELSPKPLLVKIAPDLNDPEIEAIVDIAQRLNLAGIIATNTTVSRENLKTKINQNGGLSGKPVFEKSNEVIKKVYRFSGGKLPIIGVGGIFTPDDAFKKIACGASLLQAYTGFVYRGFGFARQINSGLAQILRERGFHYLEEAVGSSVKVQ
jgi:dihydroorotate dehydrogenase